MLLDVKKLSAGYGGMRVLDNVSIHLDSKEIVAVIGPNGSGKSTLLKCIAGILFPENGEMRMSGEPIHHRLPNQLLRRGIVYIPQNKRLFPSLTVKDNLQVMLHHLPSEERTIMIDQILTRFPILKERDRVLAGSLSAGEQQIVALARAMALIPKVLLLDEPVIGLSPKWADSLFQKIHDIAQSGSAVLLVEQQVRRALDISERTYVLKAGRVALEGSSKDILRHEKFREAFLGKA